MLMERTEHRGLGHIKHMLLHTWVLYTLSNVLTLRSISNSKVPRVAFPFFPGAKDHIQNLFADCARSYH